MENIKLWGSGSEENPIRTFWVSVEVLDCLHSDSGLSSVQSAGRSILRAPPPAGELSVCGAAVLQRGALWDPSLSAESLFLCVQVHLLLREAAGPPGRPLAGSSLLRRRLPAPAKAQLWSHLSAAVSPW